MASKNKFYVTTPIYYVNASPHVGHLYTTIAADIISRWNRLSGKDVFFLTGTDEHGQKVQEAAEKAGKTPKQFVDKIAKEFQDAFKLLNISNDNFLRTTNPFHEKEVQKVLQELYDKKHIYKGFYEALYCIGCEQYKTESDLVDGKCPLHKTTPELRKEEAYLFRLSAFQNQLLKLIKAGTYKILPEIRKKEIISFIESGLKDISISRLKEKVSWGIPLPFDKNHTCFVWVDAFWNYITGLKEKNAFKKFWPADVQLMAKDIIRVHATIWPALLLATRNKLPKTLFVHGYFTINGQKISKSLGNAISPVYFVNRYGTDSLRYFLARNIPFGEDGDFSEKVLAERHNNELADKLGNLVSRVSALAEKYGTEKCKNKLLAKLNTKKIEKLFSDYELDKVLNEIFAFIDLCNEHVQNKKPWETHDKKVLYELADSIKAIAELLWPFIPETAEKIKKQFSAKNIKKEEILFRKIE
ncbi:MAG: methionine--tRNA ligase [Nanoarchaeota archaeon]